MPGHRICTTGTVVDSREGLIRSLHHLRRGTAIIRRHLRTIHQERSSHHRPVRHLLLRPLQHLIILVLKIIIDKIKYDL